MFQWLPGISGFSHMVSVSQSEPGRIYRVKWGQYNRLIWDQHGTHVSPPSPAKSSTLLIFGQILPSPVYFTGCGGKIFCLNASPVHWSQYAGPGQSYVQHQSFSRDVPLSWIILTLQRPEVVQSIDIYYQALFSELHIVQMPRFTGKGCNWTKCSSLSRCFWHTIGTLVISW